MKRVVRTRREVRFTETIAWKRLKFNSIRGIELLTNLKEEFLEEVCGVDNGEDEDGWKVDGEDRIENPASENDFQLDSFV